MIWQRGLAIIIAIVLAILTGASPSAALTWSDIRGGSGKMAVSMINVGQGNCVVIGCPNGDKLLADCGSSNFTGSDRQSVIDYVSNFLNGTQFHAVIVSHGDKDHYSLIPSVAPVDNRLRYVYIPKDESNPIDYPTGFQQWLNQVNNATTTLVPLSQSYFDPANTPNTNLSCSGGTSNSGVYILAANLGEGFASNDQSIVAFLRHARSSTSDPFTVMLPGDAEGDIAATVLSRYSSTSNFLETDVMMASHHGAANGMTNDLNFLAQTQPKSAIFSAAKDNSFYHPRCSTVDTIGNNGSILGTSTSHDLTCGNNITPGWELDRINDARFNTINSGAIVSISDGDTLAIYTCPNNNPVNCVKVVD